MKTKLVAASCLAGLVLGFAGRLVMRFVALESGMEGAFSMGGTIEVVAFGAIVGAPVAFLFLTVLRRPPAGAIPWRGAVVGLTLFALMALIPPDAARSALQGTPDTPAATAAAFAVMFVAWGVWLEHLAGRLFRARAASTVSG